MMTKEEATLGCFAIVLMLAVAFILGVLVTLLILSATGAIVIDWLTLAVGAIVIAAILFIVERISRMVQ